MLRIRRQPPLLRGRGFRATPPSQIGPLIAGLGAAAVIYGTSLLLKAARNPKFQEAMRDGAAKTADAARSAAASSASRRGADAPPSPSSPSTYFTTDAMGLDVGQGYKEWSSASVAIVEGGEARVVESEQGGRSTPSLVAFLESGETLVGWPAKKLVFSRTATPVHALHLLFGVRHASEACGALASQLPYALTEGAGGLAAVDVHGAAHLPSELAGRVIAKLKQSAESAAGRRGILSAVAGVRPRAAEAEREALLAAGAYAGLELQLVDEPVLALLDAAGELPALREARRVGVYIWGGRSFSFSVLARGAGGGEAELEWEVAESRWAPFLGSEGIDEAIVRHMAQDFRARHGIDLERDHLALQRLHDAAETAKAELCSSFSTQINLPFISASLDGPLHLNLSLSRQALAQLIEPLLERTLGEVDAALAAAALSPAELDAVLLVGASARAPAVFDALQRHFGRPPLRTSRPEDNIAKGAALRAHQLHSAQFGA